MHYLITQIGRRAEEVMDTLADGRILCHLINRLLPGSLPPHVHVMVYNFPPPTPTPGSSATESYNEMILEQVLQEHEFSFYEKEEMINTFLFQCYQIGISSELFGDVHSIIHRFNVVQLIYAIHFLATVCHKR